MKYESDSGSFEEDKIVSSLRQRHHMETNTGRKRGFGLGISPNI